MEVAVQAAEIGGGLMTDLEWLSPKQVEERYGVRVLTLKSWRETGYGPKGVHFGRLVKYRRVDWEAWVALQTMKAQTS
jgi:hypothetical protein